MSATASVVRSFTTPSPRYRLSSAIERNLRGVIDTDVWVGDGPYAKRCEALIREQLGVHHAYLMPSCTSALEVACLVAGIGPGDEVIMPSFGFSSAANAAVLRGATPVFVDIRPDTLNIDEKLVGEAITPRTRAIILVHYAGVCCNLSELMRSVGLRNATAIPIIEDAAQAYLSSFAGVPAGNLGDLAAFSFHHTKNIRCGEGGALVTHSAYAHDIEIIREKGTDRSAFLRGERDKYTWIDVGVSGVVSEFQAAVLLAELDAARETTARRLSLWERYDAQMVALEQRGLLERPTIPSECRHNGHIYRVMLPTGAERDRVLAALRQAGVGATFHFVPLHSSPAGRMYGRVHGSMAVTDSASARLLRLPLTHATTEEDVDRAVEALERALLQ